MNVRNNIFGLMAVCLIWACSKSDDGAITTPEVIYQQELTATFFTEGQSDVPQVDWNGDVGKFGLNNTVEGITINEETGVILWDKTLSVGNHNLEVIAFNDAGSTAITVVLENELVGNFKGSYLPSLVQVGASDFTIALQFQGDGSFSGFFQSLFEGSVRGPHSFFGTWSIEDDIIYGELSEDSLTDFINYTHFEAVILTDQNEPLLYGFLGKAEPSDPFAASWITE